MGILQARILQWVFESSSRRSSQPKDWTQVTWCRRILYWLSHQETDPIWSESMINSVSKTCFQLFTSCLLPLWRTLIEANTISQLNDCRSLLPWLSWHPSHPLDHVPHKMRVKSTLETKPWGILHSPLFLTSPWNTCLLIVSTLDPWLSFLFLQVYQALTKLRELL